MTTEKLTYTLAEYGGLVTHKRELRKIIGDVGESLSYSHEIRRIRREGYQNVSNYVRWLSRYSDRFGYDIQSIRGTSYPEYSGKTSIIRIEVKSTISDNVSQFRFYLTRPEWERALEDLKSYYFHCWAGVDVNKGIATHGPYIVPAPLLRKIVPTEVSSRCEWTECRVVLDLLEPDTKSEKG